jgi:hypothetical protein
MSDLNELRKLAGLPLKEDQIEAWRRLAGLPLVEERGSNQKARRVEDELRAREKMIDRIEGYFGALESIPYSEITTEDLKKIYDTLLEHKQIKATA